MNEKGRQQAVVNKLTSRELSLLEQADVAGRSDLQYQQIYSLINKYGLTVKQYVHLLDDQNGRCKICQTIIRGTYETPTGRTKLRACVDHDHGSSTIRGLLCHNCNVGIGLFKESIRNLASAIVYLEDNGKTFT